MREKRRAGGRQRHAAGAAVEQRDAEVLLELANALGQRRLAERKLARRRAEIAGTRHCEEGTQEPDATKQSHYRWLWITEQIEFYSMPSPPYARRIAEDRRLAVKAVFVLFDSLTRNALGCYGSPWVRTPNFDRFAARGVTFDRHFVGSLPCMPARRDLHTG